MDAVTEELAQLDAPKVIDDAFIGDTFVDLHRDNYALLRGEWHTYDPETGFWTECEREIKRTMGLHLKRYRRRKVSVTPAKIKSILEYCESYLPETDELPSNADLIPLRNGVYNVRTGKLHAHRPENYFRHGLAFDYDPDAHYHKWWETLSAILVHPDGTTDYDLIEFVQEAMGYCFWGDNRMQAAFFFYGEGGTGKSTIIEVLQGMIHSTMPIDLETFNEYQMASLVDVRLAVVSEFEDNATFPEAAFKRLLSSDLVYARLPHGRPFKFQPICSVVGAMNSLPRVKDRSRGVFRRVHVVPFRKVVTEPDIYLPQKLQKEQAGIFAWAMEGLTRLRERGYFEPPQQVIEANNDWRYRNDTERQFLNSRYCSLKDADAFTQTAELYKRYKEWSKENGTYPKSQAAVARDWKRLGLKSAKQDNQRGWLGVKLLVETMDLNDVPF